MNIDTRVFRWDREFSSTLIRLAVPIIIQSLFMAMMHIVDNVMIGRLGLDEFAGVTQANRVTFLLEVTMFGCVSGASIFTAQMWGVHDVAGIRSTLGLGMIAAGCLSLVFAIPSIVCPDLIMRLLIEDTASIKAGAEYLRVIGVAYIVQAISMVQSAVLKSTEQVRLPMTASITAILTNTLFNYALIFGRLGFPRMGIRGGALATLLGACVELTLLLSIAYKKNYATAAKWRELKPYSTDMVKRYFRIVAPVMLNEGFWSLGMVVYSAVYGYMGKDAAAAANVYNNMEMLTTVVLRGATHACAVMVGMAIGSGAYEKAQLIARRMAFGHIVMGAVVGVAAWFLADGIVALFSELPASTAILARDTIRTFTLVCWMQAACTLLVVGVLRAGGDVKFSMLLDVLPVWLIGVPLVWWTGLELGWSLPAVFLVGRIEEFVKMVIAYFRMYSKKWINNLVA